MSLDKAIQHKKEKRKPYRGSKAIDCTCRNHGSCSYCENNRTIFDVKARMRVEGQEDEFFGYWSFIDPSDAICDYYDEKLEKMGIDPWDFETRDELGV
jgi:hypothetical protein